MPCSHEGWPGHPLALINGQCEEIFQINAIVGGLGKDQYCVLEEFHNFTISQFSQHLEKKQLNEIAFLIIQISLGYETRIYKIFGLVPKLVEIGQFFRLFSLFRMLSV